MTSSSAKSKALVFDTPAVFIRCSEGIAFVKLKGKEFTSRDAQDYVSVVDLIRKRLPEYAKPVPVLFDIRDVDFVTANSAGHLLSDKVKGQTKACAVLVGNLSMPNSFLLHAVLRIQSLKFPIKSFYNEKEAVMWLRQFVEKEAH